MGRITTLIINPTLALLFGIGLLVFMYGLVEMMWGMRTGKVDEKGKEHMLWGVIGMTIMVSSWGIIRIIDSTFNLGSGNKSVEKNIVR